ELSLTNLLTTRQYCVISAGKCADICSPDYNAAKNASQKADLDCCNRTVAPNAVARGPSADATMGGANGMTRRTRSLIGPIQRSGSAMTPPLRTITSGSSTAAILARP